MRLSALFQILLTEECRNALSGSLSTEEGLRMKKEYGAAGTFLSRLSPTVHYNLENCWKQVCEHKENPYILSVGGGPKREHPVLINLNIGTFRNVDIVGDAHKLPIKSGVLDGIVCNAVLEHCKRPWDVASEFRKALRPGGYLFAETPFLQPVHAYPADYFRFTVDGLRSLFCDFHELEAGVIIGPTTMLTVLIRKYMELIMPGRIIKKLVRLTFGAIAFPLNRLDLILRKKKGIETLAGRVYFLGKNPA
jgi:SAM-dependent methyltransferase